ncbi:MAG TPA: cytochrome c biogenesis protein CcsA [Candidatus Angelobacter sp.]|nr:cytochrome c biogenesis protein CcsA [Candidatus Angelobacter sp.]
MKKAFFLCAVITLGLLAYGTYQGLVVAPREETMGEAQRIFYYHVPAASSAYMLFFINFVASIVYLCKRSARADAVAIAAAEVGLVFATVTLALGMIWARYAWGRWWAWDSRLTTFLVLWLLYVSYRVLRRSAEAGSTAVLAAALAIMVFIGVPLNYMANRWFRTNHPQPVTLDDPRMKFALLSAMIAFLAFALLLLWFRYHLERIAQELIGAYIRNATHGVMTSLALPAILLYQLPTEIELHHQRTFMYGGYIVAWTIYLSYVLLLVFKLNRLQKEAMSQGVALT